MCASVRGSPRVFVVIVAQIATQRSEYLDVYLSMLAAKYGATGSKFHGLDDLFRLEDGEVSDVPVDKQCLHSRSSAPPAS
jgi:hypothetical protein